MSVEGPGLIFTILSFALALSLLVFVHELGHYLVARAFGVRVSVFSIGFGRELAGYTDRHGTRWKLSLLPLGGYVRFFGDANEASGAAEEEIANMTAAERAVCFHHRPVGQRAAIVAAGPAINFLFAILIYFALFISYGRPVQPAVVAEVLPDSAAETLGLRPGDRILAVSGHGISDARSLIQTVSLYPAMDVDIIWTREGRQMSGVVTLGEDRITDRFGNEYRRGMLGIALEAPHSIEALGPLAAFKAAGSETLSMVRLMLTATGQVIMGVRSLDDLGGPVKIAKLTGEQASLGLVAFIGFVALISINLGLVNLLPIPTLDGGHLLFYLAEAVRGAPLSRRLQEVGFMIGFALIVALMLLITLNDLQSL